MNKIVLTKEHEDKLLEMCSKLFPEYTFQFYHPINMARMLVGFKKENDSDLYDDCDIFIHWFEFCMTHLTYKIYPLIDNRWENAIITREMISIDASLEDDMNVFMSNLFCKHPVDYLYEEFNKINK